MSSTDPACKIPHDGADDLPQFLCRRCHPELTLPPVNHAALAASVAEKHQHDSARAAILRDLDAARLQLEFMVKTYGNDARTAQEKQRKRIAKLEKKLEGVSNGPTEG